MSKMEELLKNEMIPPFHLVRRIPSRQAVTDVAAELRQQLTRDGTLDRVRPGSRVAITAGSRSIDQIAPILQTLIEELRRIGAEPFILAAMGMHGGATAEGQLKLLQTFGITEKAMGVPVLATMETVPIGRLNSGWPVQLNRMAATADYIIPVNRIRPHTEFHGAFESGLMKMIAIGLGSHENASYLHQLGFKDMSRNLLQMARTLLEQCPIPFGVAILENTTHSVSRLVALPAELIEEEEPMLLLESKEMAPVIGFPKVDILIVEEMGKDFSSTGLDPEVTGRSAFFPPARPFIDRIGVLGLSRQTVGDAYGIGLCDCVTQRLFKAIDFERTYHHAVMTQEVAYVRIPPIMATDEQCLRLLIRTCPGNGPTGSRIVWVRNTLDLSEFHVSEGLMLDTLNRQDLSADLNRVWPTFDAAGRFHAFER